MYKRNLEERGDLEEGTVRALSPQALGARFVLAVSLIDLQVLHLHRAKTEGKKPQTLLLTKVLVHYRSTSQEKSSHPL